LKGEESWERIERWLAVNAPEIAEGLNPPASADEIATTERLLDRRLPDDVRAAYLRHDGQQSDAPWFLYGWEWLSLARIRDEWSVWRDLLDGGDFDGTQSDGDGQVVRDDWWNSGWIPVTYDGSGNHYCVDLSPGPQGTAGQVIEMWHDDDSRPVVDASFDEWIARFAAALEAGEYITHDDYDGLVHRNDV
jgi:cell wall assembly regulator SMI1